VKNPPITVRRAVPDDFEAIRTLLGEGDTYHRSLDIFGLRPDHVDYDRLSFDTVMEEPTTLVLVAMRGGAIDGFVRAEHVAMPEGRLHLERTFVMVHEIVIAANARGNGLGQRLIRSVADWAVKRGAPSVELNVFTQNAPARAFYRELGFDEQMLRLRINTPKDRDHGAKDT
jgi:ribosomal protein S18 acetylase RimI-like enzyme